MTGGQTATIRVLPGSALSLTTPPPPPSSQPPPNEAIFMGPDDECIRNFSRHCHSFYLSSLSPASSNQSSLHEETAIANSTGDCLVQMTSDGKVVLEAFDRICAIGAIGANNNNHNTVQEVLQNEHDLCAKSHSDLLNECGLLEIDHFTTLDNAATLLQKYTEVRNAMRRQAHKSAMSHRQNSFFELLSRAEQDCLTYPIETCALPTVNTSNHTATTVDGIKAILSSIDKFVTKYRPKIGSHSFLAGLHKFIYLQLTPKSGNKHHNSDPSYVVQWTFRGSVLTEACVPAAADGDQLSYARDALKVLFSFLILSKENDIEGGSPEDAPEPMVSFEIHKHVSDITLRRILKALPNPKDLDARATGSLTVLTNSDGENIARENADGHLDEPW
eukprot:CAMPEP_0201698470 /NCGR_PEP_ID=MMETSP0578-20130828/19447_1 /ASSEMBLY_ACC=CAM_ASM_000663 /TAXON_ID=267565 /ORGANISM="Skeletonema grethea, Strain CCMP 1804" /LENGTH=388 /DNA_ID=CAMNT_0048185019 /DNA_START=229 /DNA_END=1392 /DNA_ORIENTATION=+